MPARLKLPGGSAPPTTQAEALRRRAASAHRHHQRRARAAGLALDYTGGDLRRLAESATLCHYCRSPLDLTLTWDHAQPTDRGGSHALHNLRTVCDRCNRLKGRLTESEFRALLALLHSLPPDASADLSGRILAGGRRYRGRRGADHPATERSTR